MLIIYKGSEKAPQREPARKINPKLALELASNVQDTVALFMEFAVSKSNTKVAFGN